MLERLNLIYNRYVRYKAKTALMDFACIHMDELSVGEIAKILEVANIIRDYEKVDNKPKK